MKLLHYSVLVSFIIFSVTFVARSDTIKTGRKYPAMRILTSRSDREIRACSLDLSNCDTRYFGASVADLQWPLQYASYNNVIYSFLGFSGKLLIFDVYGNETRIQQRISVSNPSEPSNVQPVTAVHNGYLYTALGSKLYKCSINGREICEVIMDDAKFRELRMIRFHTEYIYMRFNGRTERCASFSECYSVIGSAGIWGSAVDLAGEYLYVDGNITTHVIRCKTDTMKCNGLNIGVMGNEYIYGLFTFNKSIYLVGNTTGWKCKLTDFDSCEPLAMRLNDRYFIISYSSVDMLSVHREEDKRCGWQPEDVCRNHVTYEKDITRLELSVSRHGKLIDAGGKLFDTSNASYIQFGTANATNGMRAAMFVMDNGGSIFASNYHEPHKYHHSSLLAGKPASSAGFLQVSDGVIKFVNSCSNHYRAPAEISEQFLDSLYKQGYSASVVRMDHNCPYEKFTVGDNAVVLNTVQNLTNGQQLALFMYSAVF